MRGLVDEILGHEDTTELQPWSFEIENEADGKPSDPEVVHHLPKILVGNVLDDFRFDHDGVKSYKVRDVKSDARTFISDIESSLLNEGDAALREFDAQRILVWL